MAYRELNVLVEVNLSMVCRRSQLQHQSRSWDPGSLVPWEGGWSDVSDLTRKNSILMMSLYKDPCDDSDWLFLGFGFFLRNNNSSQPLHG